MPLNLQFMPTETPYHNICYIKTGKTDYKTNEQIAKDLNEVIPLCINSIYLIYHIFPSTQHTSLSLPLHVST